MAASETPATRLWQETTCSLCRRLFTDPVMLLCGHVFCQGCILKYWGEPRMLASFCPQCQARAQQEAWRPTPQLGSIVDVARQLNDQVIETVTWGVCEKHQRPLKFFCKLDGVPVCVLCKGYRKHADHPVVPAEAAAEEYKAQIGTCLENLKKKKEELLASKENTEKQGQDLLETIEKEKQRTVAAFTRFRKLLEEVENRLLAQMEEVGKEIAKKRDKGIARLSEELSSLEKTIEEMKEKCEKPPRELLKDITSLLQRYEQNERFETPVSFPPALKWRIWDFWDTNPILENVAKKVKDSLEKESLLHKEKVILDPDTAHSWLLISKDGRSVTMSAEPQRRPPGFYRFVHFQGVVGSKSFESGRHCWEVEVGEEEGWAVGISVLSFQYDDLKPIGPEAGVWAIGKWGGQYRAVNHPLDPPLPLSKEPKKIRVSLNCMGCQVAFFDAETAALLYTFSIPGPPAPAYCPFFWVTLKAELRLGQ